MKTRTICSFLYVLVHVYLTRVRACVCALFKRWFLCMLFGNGTMHVCSGNTDIDLDCPFWPDLAIKSDVAIFVCLRPKNILLARFISRNACQCIHHQNMAFKVQAMRRCGVKISDNPENILAHESNLNELFECNEQENRRTTNKRK